MATIAKRAISVVKTIHGNSPWTQRFREAASCTFKAGELVILDGSGYVTVSGTDPASILGVAAEDAHNYSATGVNNTISVWVADDETIFKGNVINGSAVTALTQVGIDYGVTISGSTWHVDLAKVGTSSRVTVVDLSANYDGSEAIGDTNGTVHFLFKGWFRRLDHTS